MFLVIVLLKLLIITVTLYFDSPLDILLNVGNICNYMQITN